MVAVKICIVKEFIDVVGAKIVRVSKNKYLGK